MSGEPFSNDQFEKAFPEISNSPLCPEEAVEVEQNHGFSSDAVSVDHEGPGRGAGLRGRRDDYITVFQPILLLVNLLWV